MHIFRPLPLQLWQLQPLSDFLPPFQSVAGTGKKKAGSGGGCGIAKSGSDLEMFFVVSLKITSLLLLPDVAESAAATAAATMMMRTFRTTRRRLLLWM